MDKKIIKNFLLFFSGSFLMSVLLYVYQILAWRFLSIWDYWNLTSIMSYYTLICIPIFSLWIFVTKYLSIFYEEWDNKKIEAFKNMIYKNLLKVFWIYYLIAFIILIFFWNIIKISFLEAFILIITSFVSLYFSYNQSINYAKKNTKLYSIIWIIDIVIRIWFWLFFIFLWFWYIWAFLWFIIGNISANYLNIYLNRKNDLIIINSNNEYVDFDYKEIKSFIIPTIAFTSFWLIINNIDLILAKMYLDWENLWYYSAVIIISRIIIFWLSIFTAFIVPYLTNYKKYNKIIIITYIIIIFTWIISILLFYFFPNLIINILFWEKYLWVSNYLFYWAIIWFLYVIINLIMNHFILIWNKKYAYIWYIFISILIWIITFFSPNDFESFVKYIMYSYLVSFLVMLFFILFDYIKRITRK